MTNPQTNQPFSEAETQENLRMLAKTLDIVLNGPSEPKTNGFFLLIFPFGQPNDEHRANYISNANREDMIATIKELLARLEGRMVENNGTNPV